MFKEGDIIAYDHKNQTLVRQIERVNAKTYDIGDARISHTAVRHSTDDQRQMYLDYLAQVNNMDVFNVGDIISCANDGVQTDKITKFNRLTMIQSMLLYLE